MNAASPIDRRDFVAACALSLLTPMLGACASLATLPVPMEGGRIRLRLSDHPALAQPGGSIKILPGSAKDPLYVLALPASEFAVLSSVCSHRGCTVDVKGSALVCPCHGSTYDREGRVLRGPAERSLERYSARVAEGMLDIEVRAAQ